MEQRRFEHSQAHFNEAVEEENYISDRSISRSLSGPRRRYRSVSSSLSPLRQFFSHREAPLEVHHEIRPVEIHHPLLDIDDRQHYDILGVHQEYIEPEHHEVIPFIDHHDVYHYPVVHPDVLVDPLYDVHHDEHLYAAEQRSFEER